MIELERLSDYDNGLFQLRYRATDIGCHARFSDYMHSVGRVLARQAEPILEPKLAWEQVGFVPNVTFSNGHAVKGDDIYVYYGGADTVIGVAALRMSDVRS